MLGLDCKANNRVQFGYGLNYLIDIGHAVIVDVEATRARTYDEVAATKTMIERTDKRFGLKPEHLACSSYTHLAGGYHRVNPRLCCGVCLLLGTKPDKRSL
jgi:hypothetical protein